MRHNGFIFRVLTLLKANRKTETATRACLPVRHRFARCGGQDEARLPERPAGLRRASVWACLLLAALPAWVGAQTAEILVRLAPGTDARAFAGERGLVFLHTLRSDPDMHVLRGRSADESRAWVAAWRASGRRLALRPAVLAPPVGASPVLEAWLNERTRHVRMAFIPDDPYFPADHPAGFPGQWHLDWPEHPEWDARVQGAWNRDLTGEGVTIGVVDDGLDTRHPDLAPNYDAADSWDFARDQAEPDPVNPDDNHGTSVAGVAAARGGNGLGVTGAAPRARLAGLRVALGDGPDTGRPPVSALVDATKYHSFGTNLNIRVKNHSYGADDPFPDEDAERAAFEASALAGTIHCLSAGNERDTAGEDANKKGISSSPYVITVAALASSGVFASYSCFGACVMVTAPSSSQREGEREITTTDRAGADGNNNAQWADNPFPDQDYTADFGGTSSASPLVAGIMALGVQANPKLEVRLAKHLLVRSCDRVDPADLTEASDGGWKTNAAGFGFNPNYGFGKINADRFTQLARLYSGVTPLEVRGQEDPIPVAAPLAPGGDVSRTFEFAPTNLVETVQIRLQLAEVIARDMEAYLVSPAGTRSRLFMRCPVDTNSAVAELDWVFASHAFFGERPAGIWTITVRNTGDSPAATWTAYQFVAHLGQPILAAPVILADSLRRLPDGRFQFAFAGGEGRHYQVYAASELGDWSLLQEVVMTGATAVVLDPEVGQARRFYRVVAP